MNKRLHNILFRALTLVLCVSFVCSPLRATVHAALDDHYDSPKLANYFLKWEITEAEARQLAKWDLVILDMEVQARNPELLKKMREWNPNIVLLVYITPQEIIKDASNSYSLMRRKLASGINPDWYLYSKDNLRLSWWSGTYLLNITNNAPTKDGQKLNTYIANFVTSELLSTGLWDGVFYDNSWDNITYFVGKNIDTNFDHVEESNVDLLWRQGLETIYRETRRIAGENIILVGNNDTIMYLNDLNGKLLENFSQSRWTHLMDAANVFANDHREPRVSIINANTENTGIENYQAMRFGLASSLLEDLYFTYDDGDKSHTKLWWYDEYNVSLGQPLGVSRSGSGGTPETSYKEDIWSRNFENGIAVVNSTNETKTVALNGEYEKIHGTQDPVTNDGSIVSEVTLAPKDGLVLLKTFETLKHVVFTNGFFARFFKPSGDRARNGMFVFEEGQEGGAQIAHIDLDFNNKEELIVVDQNKIQVWRDDEQLLFKMYPYGANYTGSLQVAVGDLNNDGFYEIYTAPSAGFKEPIRAYNRHGDPIGTDFFPLGKTYKGGYHIALTKATEKMPSRLIVGSGTGVAPTVTLFEYNFKKLKSFAAFESGFRGGISVAAGDVDGDGVQEIITGKGQGGAPTVRIFSLDGKEKYKSFNAYTTLFKPGVDVRTIDIDFDGADEIMTLSEGAL